MPKKKFIQQSIRATKNKWMRPVLIILTRGGNQEKILLVCKNRFISGPGRTGFDPQCILAPDDWHICHGFVQS